MRTLVIQSCSDAQRGSWLRHCLASVESWTRQQGHDYRFTGDAIFQVVPEWYLAKVGNKLPVATDYGRLALLQRALDEGYEQAIWLDADLVVFDSSMRLDFDGTCAFGQEVWIQEKDGRLDARRNAHNAVCVFRQGCPVLPFLRHTVRSLVRRVDPQRIAPQFAGPKLLNALHPLCDFALLPQVGAASPLVLKELGKGAGPALGMLRERSSQMPQALNICASLATADIAEGAVLALLQRGRL